MGESGYQAIVKGVLVQDGRVLLVRGERADWELPGGRIEPGETPEECVVREIAKATGLRVDVAQILDSRVDRAAAAQDMFIVTYGCVPGPDPVPVLDREHNRVAEHEVPGLAMPPGDRRSVTAWFDRLRATGPQPRKPPADRTWLTVADQSRPDRERPLADGHGHSRRSRRS
uniref:NUDIX domain-containing protein n=1 Tax=Amycolatopsis sp. CA-096443 TaxID=3239919 RepID=UPI003F497B3A